MAEFFVAAFREIEGDKQVDGTLVHPPVGSDLADSLKQSIRTLHPLAVSGYGHMGHDLSYVFPGKNEDFGNKSLSQQVAEALAENGYTVHLIKKTFEFKNDPDLRRHKVVAEMQKRAKSKLNRLPLLRQAKTLMPERPELRLVP